MKVCRSLLIVAALSLVCATVNADDDKKRPLDAKSIASIFDKVEPASLSEKRNSRMSVAELRQARALFKADQRRARLEHNAWIGYQQLRPSWSTVPMMRSHYERPTLYLPVYYYRR
jgi:hypothetical protein